MNCKEILEMAARNVGPVPFLTEGRLLLNAALREIGPYLRLPGEPLEIDAERRTWYDLPSDLLKVKEVLDEDGDRYRWWQADIGRIRFEHKGKVTVHYYRAAEEITQETQEPEGDPRFHDVLVLCVSDKKQPAQAWMQLKVQKLQDVLDEMPPQTGRRIKARPWV